MEVEIEQNFSRMVSEQAKFVRKQKEISEVQRAFAAAIDDVKVNGPEGTGKDLTIDADEFDYEYEEEDESESDYDSDIRQRALLLMHDIDRMRRDTYRVLTWFRPAAVKKSAKLANLRDGVVHLYQFLEDLRIRAEKLL
jgi:hypothetical protein